MLYLLLAVLCSSAVNVVMRLSEGRSGNVFAMFMTNYAVCAFIAFLFLGGQTPFAPQEGMRFAVLLGLIGGGIYLASLSLLRVNITKNGVMLASVFMKLGVLVPALMAIFLFHEKPTAPQLIGFAAAIAAILVIYIEPKADRESARGTRAWGLFLLLALLVTSGLVGSLANIYDKLGVPAIKDHFLFCNFLTAFALSGVAALIARRRVSKWDLLLGVMIGVPNYFCTRCLLLSLSYLPAVVVYPVYNVGAIVVISLFGILLFGERPGRRKLIGLGMIVAALALLNL